MGRNMFVGLLAISFCLIFGSCDTGSSPGSGDGGFYGDDKNGGTGTVKITYYENKTADDTKVFLEYPVLKNTATTKPVTKPSKSGYEFEDWFTAKDRKILFDFAKTLSSDTVVYAGYTNNLELPVANDNYYTLPFVFDRVLKDTPAVGLDKYTKKKFENEYGDYITFVRLDNGFGDDYRIIYFRNNVTNKIDIAMTGYTVSIENSLYVVLRFASWEDDGGKPAYVHKKNDYFCPDFKKVKNFNFIYSLEFKADGGFPNFDFHNPDTLLPEEEGYGFSMKYNDLPLLDNALSPDVSTMFIKSYGANKIILNDSASRLYRAGVYYAVD